MVAQRPPSRDSRADPASAINAALEQHFAPHLAATLMSVARRRAKCPEGPLQAPQLVALVQALQESVPSYIVDAARQAACIASLQAIVGTLGRSSAPEIPRVVAVRTDPDVRVVTDSVKSHARQLGLPLLDQTKLMTAAAELARNILQYAGKGEVRFRPVDPPRKGLVIEAEDRGPGIPDVNRVLSPDYVSKTGMGIGLQGTKRLVDEFEIRSGPGLGTTVTLRKYA